ncbi:hypothetical protein KY334_05330 [Candidatus Woesearchaeota archaeon]|nr:hypothetical protein [Candidatus Woesearchaeota archaeon]
MVSQKQKDHMKEYIANDFTSTGKYVVDLIGKNGIVLTKIPQDLFEVPKTIYIMTIADKNIDEKIQLQNQVLKKYDCLSHIFYGNNKDFHVRLSESAQKRKNKSLKRYRAHLNELFHLRDLEKRVLNLQSLDSLTYYMPETDALQEKLVRYDAKNVILDYSHITPDDRAYNFVEECVSDDYKLFRKPIDTMKGPGFIHKSGNRVVCAVPSNL